MSRFVRKTVLALAAIASVGAFALISNDASARGFGGGGGMRMGGGHGGGIHVGGGGVRHIGGGGFRRIGVSGRRIIVDKFPRPTLVRHHHPRFHWRYGWRRNYWVAPVIATGIATGVVSAPTWNRCSCLTKEYTPEGVVVFKDVCTNEIATNPPLDQPSSAAYDPSQQPQVQTR